MVDPRQYQTRQEYTDAVMQEFEQRYAGLKQNSPDKYNYKYGKVLNSAEDRYDRVWGVPDYVKISTQQNRDAANDAALREQAANKPGIYRLSDGSVITSSLSAGQYGRVTITKGKKPTTYAQSESQERYLIPAGTQYPVEGPMGVSYRSLPANLEVSRGFAEKLGQAEYGVSQRPGQPPSLAFGSGGISGGQTLGPTGAIVENIGLKRERPFSTTPEAQERAANLQRARDDFQFFIPKNAGGSPFTADLFQRWENRVAPAVARDESRRIYANPVPATKEDSWGRRAASSVVDGPNEFFMEPLRFTRIHYEGVVSASAVAVPLGKGVTMAGRAAPAAGKLAEKGLLAAGVGIAGYSVYRDPESLRYSSAMALSGAAFAGTYGRINVNQVSAGRAQGVESDVTLANGKLGGVGRAKTNLEITEFGKTRTQQVETLITYRGSNAKSPTGSYAVEAQASTEPFLYRGTPTRLESRYLGVYRPQSNELFLSQGKTVYASRTGKPILEATDSITGVQRQVVPFRALTLERGKVVGDTAGFARSDAQTFSRYGLHLDAPTVGNAGVQVSRPVRGGYAVLQGEEFLAQGHSGSLSLPRGGPSGKSILRRLDAVQEREGLPVGTTMRPSTNIAEVPFDYLHSLGRRGSLGRQSLIQERYVQKQPKATAPKNYGYRNPVLEGLPVRGISTPGSVFLPMATPFSRTSIGTRPATVPAVAQRPAMRPLLRHEAALIPQQTPISDSLVGIRHDAVPRTEYPQQQGTVPKTQQFPFPGPGAVPPPPPPIILPGGIPTFAPSGRGSSAILGKPQSFQYMPSVTAGVFDIRGPAPKGVLTGLELRPLAKKKRR